MGQIKETASVMIHQQLTADVFSMWIETENISKIAKPGQFISVYTRDGAKLLPRPISICEIDRGKKCIRIVYRVLGEGTREFSGYGAGESIEIMGPLGNGFPLESFGQAFLIGGGIGIPPMLELAKQLSVQKQMILGYRDEVFLADEFQEYGDVFIATEDGSTGTRGNVLDVIREKALKPDVIYACGPTPMLRALKKYAEEQKIPCWISMEERMACGIGACLACVCKTSEIDEHSQVNNKRICKDGPVFFAEEVEL